MSRRRKNSDQDDSLDLLLDTVSNVFGGVMFLTLLAALLILTRGSSAVAEPNVENVEETDHIDAQLIAAEMQQIASAIAAQQRTLERLDPEGSLAEKSDRLQSLQQTITVARRQLRRAEAAVENRQQEMQDLQAAQSDLEGQIETLRQEIEHKSQQVNQVRADSERTVLFRPLRMSNAIEAVVILRYGRWYLLQEGPFGGRLNRDDFYILENNGFGKSITPKPHRGSPVTEQSLAALMERLKRSFPPQDFHITIAVWDDSFAEFNPLKDKLTKGGYQYRTLTCDSSTRLTNQAAVDPFVQ